MNTKIRCLLLDDELPGLTYLKMLCEQIPELEVVRAFNRADLFLTESAKMDFDLCILDIEMPQFNGLQIAELLKDKAIIFTTAYKDYAAQAFDLDVVDFVSKPIQPERLQKAVKKAILYISASRTTNHCIQLNTNKGKTLLYFDQLCCIKTSKTDSRDKDVLLRNGKTICLKNITFDKLLLALPSNRFCRINKQEIIALDVVQHFSFDLIISSILDDQAKPRVFSLSENYRSDFLKRVNS